MKKDETNCIIIPDKVLGSESVTGGERSSITSISKIEQLNISETNSWRCIRLHKHRITNIQYHSEMKLLITSSEDGTIKLTKIIYHGDALNANESVTFGDTVTFDGHEGKPVNGFVFSQSKSIFSFGMAREILEWDIVSLKVMRKFYVGSSVRDCQLLNGVSSQHLIALTVPRISAPDNDTMQTQWIRVFDVIGGAELQNFSKEYSSYIRGGGGSSAPHRETTSLLTRSSNIHNGLTITASRGGLSVFAVPPVWNPIGSLQLDGSLVVPVPGFKPIVTHEHAYLITVLMSPLFDFISTIDNFGLVRLWDLNSGTHAGSWTIPMGISTVGAKVSTASMDMSGQYILIGFTNAIVKILHIFSGELLLMLQPPMVKDHTKKKDDSSTRNGEIVHVMHVKLKGEKNFVIASTSTGSVISWNLGSGVAGAPGIIITLVVHPIPVTNVVVHNSMIVSVCFQQEGSSSNRNILGISTLDGRVLVLNADRVGKALINQQLDNVICTCMIFCNHVLFVGTSNGTLQCLSLTSDGLKLFEIDIKIDPQQQQNGLDNNGSLLEDLPSAVKHLTLASGGRLVATIGQIVRVWDISKFPTHELPTKDADWLDMFVPLMQFKCVGLGMWHGRICCKICDFVLTYFH